MILLVWVYYSAQILLFGAEFTQVYANRYGSHIKPTSAAIPIPEAMCNREDARQIAKEVVKSQEKEAKEEEEKKETEGVGEEKEKNADALADDAIEKVKESDDNKVHPGRDGVDRDSDGGDDDGGNGDGRNGDEREKRGREGREKARV